MEVNFFAGNKGKINWAWMPQAGCLPALFRSENEIHTVAAFNCNESFALWQYGGTFQLSLGQLASWVADIGIDDRNLLGQWAWTLLFTSWNEHSTCIISVYVPCHSAGKDTVYRQHSQYFCQNGIMDCPRHILLRDQKQQLLSWWQAGECLVFFIDVNEK
jgi:hypothetical protein